MVEVLRLSIYTFNDLTWSFAIVQFERDEKCKLRYTLSRYGLGNLRKHIEDVFNVKVKSITLAQGEISYEDTTMPITYLRIELENYDQYLFEIYDESAYVMVNKDAKSAYEDIRRFVKSFIPNISMPKSLLIGL